MDNAIETLVKLLPPLPTVLLDVGILVATLILSRVVRAWGMGFLGAINADEHLDLFRRSVLRKEKAEAPPEKSSGFGFLFTGSVYLLGIWFMAEAHGARWIGPYLVWIAGKVWLLAASVFFVLLIGNWAATALGDFFRNPAVESCLQGIFPKVEERDEAVGDTVARSTGHLVFSFLFLLIFISFTEQFQMSGLMSAAVAVWNLGLRLVTAGFALFLGFIGLSYASRVGSESPVTTGVGSFPIHARLGIVLITTIFSIDLLASTASSIVWIAILMLLAMFIAPIRGYLIDVWAGFSLEFHQVRSVNSAGRPLEVVQIEFLSCKMKDPDGKVLVIPNREILNAFLTDNKESHDPPMGAETSEDKGKVVLPSPDSFGQ